MTRYYAFYNIRTNEWDKAGYHGDILHVMSKDTLNDIINYITSHRVEIEKRKDNIIVALDIPDYVDVHLNSDLTNWIKLEDEFTVDFSNPVWVGSDYG